MDVSGVHPCAVLILLILLIGSTSLHTPILRRASWVKVTGLCSSITTIAYICCSLAIAHQPVVCSSVEYVTLHPPAGQTCGGYLQNYINSNGGYVLDPTSTSSCQFCTFATTDQLMGKNWNYFYSHRWRNVGVMIAFTILNVSFPFRVVCSSTPSFS
jgi:ABC-type multidrug transport system permease subunit